MKRYVTILFTLLAYLFLPQLEALNSDYRSDCDEDETYQNYYKPYCLYHAPGNYPNGISHELFYLIPQTGPAECCQCYDLSCYLGYIDYDFKKHLPHLKQHLEYSSQHTDCFCLWPEYSQEAAQISDTAYLLFRDLISTTALSNLIEDENEQKELVENPCWFLNKHGLTISFIAQQFRFSDYYHVCRDIENFAVSKYDEREAAKIKDRLQDILEALYPKFFALYISCYKKHPNSEIDQEIRFMKLLVNDISGLEKTVVSSKSISCLPIVQNSYDVSEFIVANLQTANIPVELESKGMISKKNQILKKSYSKALSLNVSASSTVHSSKAIAVAFSPQSDIFLEQGTLLNDLLLYKEAIQVLTQAIQLNPSNRDAYIERAMAYFETNQLQLALKDYEAAKKLTIVPPFKPGSHKAMMMMAAVYIPENKTEFSKGLVSGTVDGAKISAVEFIPSIFSCCRGILNGLWAFVCSPIEVSQEMVNTAYAIGEFISSHSTEECFQCVVPELKELSLSWDKLNDHSRGQKIGFIIGKYGVDIFAPAGALKGMNKVRALKRANTMCTLESCAASQAKQAKILEESIKRATLREGMVVDSVKSAKILIKSSNVQYHVMQPKHAWDKVLKLSGNVEEDFKKVALLLEKESIFSKECFLRSKEFSQGKIIRSDYQKTINGQKIQAVFETYVETNQTFLQDAWVITK
jgi:tetratricopeptide (TPR) repeat protein